MFIKRIQLGMIHMAVAMTLLPINSTLNRVMIKELGIAATLVALLASLPYLFSPLQVAIGSFSDRHPVLGYRRTPYILLGLLLVFLGMVISPYSAFYLTVNPWVGILICLLTFGAWGMGFNFATVSYFSLASELSGEQGRSRTISVMFFMMIAGIIVTAIFLSRLLTPYSPGTMVQAFRLIGFMALGIGLLGLLRLEKRSAGQAEGGKEERYPLGALLQAVFSNSQVKLFFVYMVLLLAAILGQDILLEPFAGEAFHLPVHVTTRITSIWGTCVLVALIVAGFLEGKVSKRSLVKLGSWSAIAALAIISLSGLSLNEGLFYTGVVGLGLATGLATVSNLSLMLDMTVIGKVGMFIGAWGMADAFARLTGSVMSGAVRDLITRFSESLVLGYIVVFLIQAGLLVVSLLVLRRVDVSLFRHQADETTVIERAALTGEA